MEEQLTFNQSIQFRLLVGSPYGPLVQRSERATYNRLTLVRVKHGLQGSRLMVNQRSPKPRLGVQFSPPLPYSHLQQPLLSLQELEM